MVLSGLLGGTCCLRQKQSSRPPKKLGPLRLPIFHSRGNPNEGEFLVRVALGDDVIDFVVDSCSGPLIVVGNTCGTACQQGAGVYTQLDERATGQKGFIAYGGGQRSNLAWAKDSYSFPTALNSDFNQQLHQLHSTILFGVITSNVSTSGLDGMGMSIMGLMSQQRPDCGKGLGILNADDEQGNFINQIFGKNGIFQRSVYSIHVDPSLEHGELILGGLHGGIKGWVPLIPGSELPILYQNPEWLIRLNRVAAIGSNGDTLTEFPSLKYARFDTGASYLLMPPPILHQTKNFTAISGLAGLQFELDNGLVWWAPVDLFVRSTAVQNATGLGGVQPNDDCPDDWCVLGNELMRDMTVAFDLENACLGFGGPLITVTNIQPSS